MEASILDLRRRMADIMKALDRNESVKISYRGRQRAILVPTGPMGTTKKQPLRDHPAFGMWKDHEELKDVTDHVRRLRQNRAV